MHLDSINIGFNMKYYTVSLIVRSHNDTFKDILPIYNTIIEPLLSIEIINFFY